MTKPTILVVEDTPDNSMLARKVLEHLGMTVAIAETGEQALQWCATQVPSLVLMDVSLPGMDGLEVTRRLRADPSFANVPILALTAHATTGWADACRSAGCTHYLTKPVRPRELGAIVRHYLGI